MVSLLHLHHHRWWRWRWVFSKKMVEVGDGQWRGENSGGSLGPGSTYCFFILAFYTTTGIVLAQFRLFQGSNDSSECKENA